MPLGYEELEPIINETLNKVRAEILRANTIGTLDLVLEKYGVEIGLPMSEPMNGNTVAIELRSNV